MREEKNERREKREKKKKKREREKVHQFHLSHVIPEPEAETSVIINNVLYDLVSAVVQFNDIWSSVRIFRNETKNSLFTKNDVL